MFLLISEIPVFLLAAGKGKTALFISLVIFCGLLASARVIQKKKHIFLHFNIEYPLTSALITLLLSVLFYLRWYTSGRIITLAKLVHLPVKQTCIVITLLLALFSLFGIGNLIKIFLSLISENNDTYTVTNKYIIIFIAFTALLTMFLNSRCSPFYPFNTWVDPNTMFTVGKGVLKGYVPYRDLYEQKGPLLIFIHTFGAAVSFDTFIGIWILELTACFVFLLIIYKITALYFGKKSILIIPLAAAIIYSCKAFKAGDLAEEFSMPFLAYALYVEIEALKKKILPSTKKFFLTGLTSGFVFWIKYSLVGLYIGWFLSLLLYSIWQHKFRKYVRGLLFIAAGVFTTSSPVILYFLLNSAVKDLFQVYFYNNIFYYANNQYSFAERMMSGLPSCRMYNSVPLFFFLIGLIWGIIRKRWKLLFTVLFTFTGMYIFVFIGAVTHSYTSFSLSWFSVFGFWIILDAIEMIPDIYEKIKYQTQCLSLFSLAMGLILLSLLSDNLRYLEFSKDELIQYQMKEIINQSNKKNPSILAYKIGDPGVNTVTGAIPNLRFFCHYYNDKLSEIAEEQQKCIETKCVDYIITISSRESRYPVFDTYEHQGCLIGMGDAVFEFYHYYTPKE